MLHDGRGDCKGTPAAADRGYPPDPREHGASPACVREPEGRPGICTYSRAISVKAKGLWRATANSRTISGRNEPVRRSSA